MGFFIRFAEVLVRCLYFHFSTYVVHAVSENHFELRAQDTRLRESYGGSAPKPP